MPRAMRFARAIAAAFAFCSSFLVSFRESAGFEETANGLVGQAHAADEPSAGGSNFQVVRVQFRGNRKVEDDAMRVNMRTVPGLALTSDIIREDVRAIWRMGYFEDVSVETTEVPGGLNVIFVVKEKPSIRKIYVSGHDEVGLSKINEVLDIKKEQILDLPKVKKNLEKVRELYIQRGFYMADVNYELRRDGTDVDVYFRVRENAKVAVRGIKFVGNNKVTDSSLRSVMFTQQSDLFSFVSSSGTYREDAFQKDLLLIQAHYHDQGYVFVKVGEPKLELSPDKQSLYITINIEEGKPYKFGKIGVRGELLESSDAYIERMRIKQGETFSRSRLSQDREELVASFKDKGYAYVNVVPETKVDEANQVVDLVFDIQRGAEVYIDRINIRGNSKTRDKVIRREMRVYEGEKYSSTGIEDSKRNVNRLGFFERVDVSEKRGDADDKLEVNVEVAEKQTGAFQVGAGFSSYENFIATAMIQQQNLLGRGQNLTVQAQLSSLRQLVFLDFVEPYFLDTNWTFGVNLYNQLRGFASFDRRTVGGALTWGYLLRDDLRLSLTYTLENVDVSTRERSRLFAGNLRSPLPMGSLANLLRSGWTSSVRALLAFDTRDNRIFTRQGWYNTISAEFAEPVFLSQNQYNKFEMTLRYFYPIWGPFILRLKLDTGYIHSRDPQGVPIFARYFVGGIFDVRGFNLWSLGPQIRAPGSQSPDSALRDERIGGNVQVVSRSEIEFPIVEKVGIKGAIFTDTGNAFSTERQYCRLRPFQAHASIDPCMGPFDLSAYRSSWGWGLRWFSPIGPLRFEWGVPFKRLPGEDSIVFEFNIGNDL